MQDRHIFLEIRGMNGTCFSHDILIKTMMRRFDCQTMTQKSTRECEDFSAMSSFIKPQTMRTNNIRLIH